MKGALIVTLLGFAAVAYAGVGILTPGEEADALGLYEKLCSGRSEGGDWGGARVWCKRAPSDNLEVVNHQVLIPGTIVPDNIVFVQPPAVSYKHNIEVTGGPGAAPKTKIYVLPQKSTHSLTSNYVPGETATSKPTVYFLKSSGQEGYRYGAPLPKEVAGYA